MKCYPSKFLTNTLFATILILIAFPGCSGDSSEDGNTAPETAGDADVDAADTAIADAAPDADSGPDIDIRDTSVRQDTSDTNEPDAGPVPIGEQCPCGGGGLTGVPCEECEGGWCYTNSMDNPTNYCTRECSIEADCDDLGAGWTCDIGLCLQKDE